MPTHANKPAMIYHSIDPSKKPANSLTDREHYDDQYDVQRALIALADHSMKMHAVHYKHLENSKEYAKWMWAAKAAKSQEEKDHALRKVDEVNRQWKLDDTFMEANAHHIHFQKEFHDKAIIWAAGDDTKIKQVEALRGRLYHEHRGVGENHKFEMEKQAWDYRNHKKYAKRDVDSSGDEKA